MDLDTAISLLKKTVKFSGTIDQKHIDLTLVSAEDRPRYEKALAVATLAINEGKLSKDEFKHRLQLD